MVFLVVAEAEGELPSLPCFSPVFRPFHGFLLIGLIGSCEASELGVQQVGDLELLERARRA
jgi:hypothetical protein